MNVRQIKENGRLNCIDFVNYINTQNGLITLFALTQLIKQPIDCTRHQTGQNQRELCTHSEQETNKFLLLTKDQDLRFGNSMKV